MFMDHRDTQNRLVRKYLEPGTEEAVETLALKKARVSLRNRVAAGAFEGAVVALAEKNNNSRSRLDLSEVSSDIEDTLVDEINDLSLRLTEMALGGMDRPMASGSQRYSNGWEDSSWGGPISTWYEIEYPERVVFTKGFKSRLTNFFLSFQRARFLKEHGFSDKDVMDFFKNPAVKQWMEKRWAKSLQEQVTPSMVPFSVHNTAEEAVYDNAEVEVTRTQYLDDGEEKELEGPMLEWRFHMRDPELAIIESKFDGKEFVVRLRVEFKVGQITRVEQD